MDKKMKYSIGAKVKIIDSKYGHGFNFGEEVIIKDFDDDEKAPYKVYGSNGMHWYVGDDEIQGEKVQCGNGSESSPDVQHQILDVLKEQNELLKKIYDQVKKSFCK